MRFGMSTCLGKSLVTCTIKEPLGLQAFMFGAHKD